MLVRPLTTSWRWLLEMTMMFLHVTSPQPHSVFKSSHPLLVSGGSWPLGRCLPHSPSQLLASKIKQTFLSTNLACLLASERQAAGFPFHTPPFGNRFWCPKLGGGGELDYKVKIQSSSHIFYFYSNLFSFYSVKKSKCLTSLLNTPQWPKIPNPCKGCKILSGLISYDSTACSLSSSHAGLLAVTQISQAHIPFSGPLYLLLAVHGKFLSQISSWYGLLFPSPHSNTTSLVRPPLTS